MQEVVLYTICTTEVVFGLPFAYYNCVHGRGRPTQHVAALNVPSLCPLIAVRVLIVQEFRNVAV